MKKLLSILLIAALTVIAPTALAEEGATRVLLGQDPSPAPVGWINADGTVDGYDRAVINAVDELLPEYEFEVEVTDFPSLFTGIDSGRYAAIVDNLTWKQERADRYLYSSEYYLWTTTVIAYQKGRTDIASLEDLGGKSTVTRADGAFIQLFCESYNEAHPDNPINITYSDQDLLVTYQQIVEGQVDFLAQELGALRNYEEQFGIDLDYLLPTKEEQEQMQNPAGYWIFPKTEEGEKLQQAVDGAFRTLKENGTLAELAEKYYGFNVFEGLED